ncbi:MAG: hypothetical protein FWC96_06105 [Oscillospiraceae bacterium]|nr:hypothetical protein [Oscillospiraceae bacterium]
MTVNLDLYRHGEEINVAAHVLFSDSFSGELSFLLSRKMKIESAFASFGECTVEIAESDELFRKANKVSVSIPQKTQELRINYSGQPEGYHTFVNDMVFAVNYYSAWYPDEISTGSADLAVRFHDNFYTHVVNASYSESEKSWEYRPKDFDCNILAYKDAKSIQNDLLCLLYIGDNDELAKVYFDAYTNAAEFCADLFETNRLSKCTLAVLPDGNAHDGYCRESLIVLGGFIDDPSYARHLLAHEIAHNWCAGADFNTWEDWLNETTAEWTSLLFLLHSGNADKFNSVIADKFQKCKNSPAIKTPDGSRPEGVHDKGTLLFYRIYQQYGYDAISKMLRLFDVLTEKTTENYIASIRENLSSDIADIIVTGIKD